jgi:hypothetical protein
VACHFRRPSHPAQHAPILHQKLASHRCLQSHLEPHPDSLYVNSFLPKQKVVVVVVVVVVVAVVVVVLLLVVVVIVVLVFVVVVVVVTLSKQSTTQQNYCSVAVAGCCWLQLSSSSSLAYKTPLSSCANSFAGFLDTRHP